MTLSSVHHCLLCRSAGVDPYVNAHGRPHYTCNRCGLIFVHPDYHPDADTERARYETHNNTPSDNRYRAFLNQLAEPLVCRLPSTADGLDYGSGPGPTLSVMLEEQGYEVAIYDPFFAPDTDVLERTYDFITCSETIEHFHFPRREFERLSDLLRPGGLLAVMTTWADEKDFETWSYARDVTHVSFYRKETMHWIADHFGWTLDIPQQNVALFRKSEGVHSDRI